MCCHLTHLHAPPHSGAQSAAMCRLFTSETACNATRVCAYVGGICQLSMCLSILLRQFFSDSFPFVSKGGVNCSSFATSTSCAPLVLCLWHVRTMSCVDGVFRLRPIFNSLEFIIFVYQFYQPYSYHDSLCCFIRHSNLTHAWYIHLFFFQQ